MKKILTIGSAMYDVFLEYISPDSIELNRKGDVLEFVAFPEGKKIEIEELISSSGGGATNTAVSFARLGLASHLIARVGQDQAGDYIIKDVETQAVNTSLVSKSATTPTGTSFILPAPSGNRVILAYRGANLELHTVPFDAAYLEGIDHIYITSLSGPTSALLPTIVALAQEKGITVSTNPGTSQLEVNVSKLEEALSHIKILILNAYEAHLLMNSLTHPHPKSDYKKTHSNNLPALLSQGLYPQSDSFMLKSFFHEILKRGPQIIVVTNGADGVYATDGKKVYHHQSTPSTIVSTVGAGDAFASTFVAYYVHGNDIKKCLQAGTINAVSVLEFPGAKKGLLTPEQIEHKLKFLSPLLLSEFEL